MCMDQLYGENIGISTYRGEYVTTLRPPDQTRRGEVRAKTEIIKTTRRHYTNQLFFCVPLTKLSLEQFQEHHHHHRRKREREAKIPGDTAIYVRTYYDGRNTFMVVLRKADPTFSVFLSFS